MVRRLCGPAARCKRRVQPSGRHHGQARQRTGACRGPEQIHRPWPCGARLRDEFLPALRAARNRVNTADEWLFAPDVRCADHARHARVTVAPGSHLLLASDGFLALASDYEAYTPQTLLLACEERGLAALGEELRAIEASDPDGIKFPRFKRSDDATALLLAIVP